MMSTLGLINICMQQGSNHAKLVNLSMSVVTLLWDPFLAHFLWNQCLPVWYMWNQRFWACQKYWVLLLQQNVFITGLACGVYRN